MKKAISTAATMVLIDHQVGTMNFVKTCDRALLEANARALARAAVALDMPLVLTTSMEDNMQGPLMPALAEIAPRAYAERVRRVGVVNCWDDEAFAQACRAPGRRQMVIAGVTNDVCVAPPAISAAEEGYEVFVVIDAGGSPSAIADEMAIRRMERAGIEVTTTNALLADVANNWASSEGGKIFPIIVEEIFNRS